MPIFITPPERGAPPRVALGDAMAAVAKPIARASDAVLGTHLTTCGGCANRRRALNALGGVRHELGEQLARGEVLDEAGMV